MAYKPVWVGSRMCVTIYIDLCACIIHRVLMPNNTYMHSIKLLHFKEHNHKRLILPNE